MAVEGRVASRNPIVATSWFFRDIFNPFSKAFSNGFAPQGYLVLLQRFAATRRGGFRAHSALNASAHREHQVAARKMQGCE